MDFSLNTWCAASFETRFSPTLQHEYIRTRSPQLLGASVEAANDTSTMVLLRKSWVFVAPDGHARIDSLNAGAISVYSTEVVTPYEVSQFVSPLKGHDGKFARQSRTRTGIDREIEDYFGRPYPQETLALLNPLLLLRDYVCVSGTCARSTILDYSALSYRLSHNPDFSVDTADDPERLGSMAIDVIFTTSDPPMLLEWSALHRGKPFSTTSAIRLSTTYKDAGFVMNPAELVRRFLFDHTRRFPPDDRAHVLCPPVQPKLAIALDC